MDRSYRWRLLEYRHTEKPLAFDTYVWAHEPELWRQLRDEAGLDERTTAFKSDWELAVQLMDWVHRLSEHQGWNEAPDLSALELLRGARAGTVTFRCVEFAHMLQQVCAAYGIPSRVIGLRRPHSEDGLGKAHVVVDVWSQQYRKWLVLDPQLNTYYTDANRRPLSAFDLHRRIRARKYDDILMSRELGLREEFREEGVDAKDNQKLEEIQVPDGFDRQEVWDSLPNESSFEGFSQFWEEYYYQFVFRQSYSLIRPKSVTGSSGGDELFYYDSGEMPPMVFQRMKQDYLFTCDATRIDFPVNGVEIQWRNSVQDNETLEIHLKHCMPWFHHYDVTVNGRSQTLKDNTLEMRLQTGENALSVTPVNWFGRRGSESVVRVLIGSQN